MDLISSIPVFFTELIQTYPDFFNAILGLQGIFFILIFLLIGTSLIKFFFKGAQSWFGLFSMVKSKKFVPLFDKFLFLGKLLDWLSDIGLVLGFGLPAIDYLWLNKKSKPKRIALLLVSFIGLYAFFYFVLGQIFNSPLINNYSLVMTLFFSVFGFAGLMVISLAISAFDILIKTLSGVKACPGVAPIIPGVQVPNVPFFIPWYGWISLVMILIVHEGFHGILLRRAKLRIKSAGLLLAGIFPIGAFVEPDENELNKAKPLDALRVYAAGPMSNLASILPGILILLILTALVFNPIDAKLIEEKNASVDFVFIESVDEQIDVCGTIFDSPAFGKLEKGMIILEINGEKTTNIFEVQTQIYKSLGTETNFKVKTIDDEIKIINLTPNKLNRFGFTMKEQLKENFKFSESYAFDSMWTSTIKGILFWFILISFFAGLVNFLPMDPFDGGKIAKIVYLPYFSFLHMTKKQTETLIGRLFVWIILVLLLLNAIPLFF